MNMIKIPNLPENDVTAAVVSGEISQKSEERLNSLGVQCIRTVRCTSLYDAVAFHPDMVMHHCGNGYIVCEPQFSAVINKVSLFSNVCLGRSLKEKYPMDIAYNAARIGNHLICNRPFTDSKIIEYCERNSIDVIHIKQGYSKCSVCIIDENSIITSDAGIATAVRRYGIDALLVDDSCVLLKRLNHGFFGGATGKIAPDKLAVNGDISYHKSCNDIKSFAAKRDVEIISLCDGYINDIGSILPICEK